MYEYTKPRGPIAGMLRGPGPCYGLPTLVGSSQHDPRSEHRKYPSWQFGVKHGQLTKDSSPGPVHYPDVKVTRSGKDGTPQYSLYGRVPELKAFRTPGPGAYCPESAGPSASKHAPKHSFGNRTNMRNSDNNPAPNSYSLPKLLGSTVESGKRQAPVFSQRGRPKVGGFSEDLQKTPGPGAYGAIDPDIYQKKAPGYTLRSRATMPGDSTQKPGPGSHNPQMVDNKKTAPSFSFGIRHSEYETPIMLDVVD